MKKKFVIIFILLFLSLFLIGCSNESEVEGNKRDTSNATHKSTTISIEEKVEIASTEEVNQVSILDNYWFDYTASVDFINEFYDNMEKNPEFYSDYELMDEVVFHIASILDISKALSEKVESGALSDRISELYEYYSLAYKYYAEYVSIYIEGTIAQDEQRINQSLDLFEKSNYYFNTVIEARDNL